MEQIVTTMLYKPLLDTLVLVQEQEHVRQGAETRALVTRAKSIVNNVVPKRRSTYTK